LPFSADNNTFGSRGILPKSDKLYCLHIYSAPPVVGWNISVWCEQFGHTNPLIFSTTPNICVLVFWQKLISFRTSANDTSYGVVTTTAPSLAEGDKYYTIDICSSDVPGGAT
jgi:hypothetical protein